MVKANGVYGGLMFIILVSSAIVYIYIFPVNVFSVNVFPHIII
jgi:hypothetical protein